MDFLSGILVGIFGSIALSWLGGILRDAKESAKHKEEFLQARVSGLENDMGKIKDSLNGCFNWAANQPVLGIKDRLNILEAQIEALRKRIPEEPHTATEATLKGKKR